MKFSIKFRPIRPGAPHLNGKVERSQRTELDEFYSSVNLKSQDLKDHLQEWQHFYNWNRPHGSLGGLNPMDKYFLLSEKPLSGMKSKSNMMITRRSIKNKIIENN